MPLQKKVEFPLLRNVPALSFDCNQKESITHVQSYLRYETAYGATFLDMVMIQRSLKLANLSTQACGFLNLFFNL
jgi:hypothetical protein